MAWSLVPFGPLLLTFKYYLHNNLFAEFGLMAWSLVPFGPLLLTFKSYLHNNLFAEFGLMAWSLVPFGCYPYLCNVMKWNISNAVHVQSKVYCRPCFQRPYFTNIFAVSSLCSNDISISNALRGTLLIAKEQSRITCGVYDTAKRMEINPVNIMLCDMSAEYVSDVTMLIHFTLMEAFCWENEIRLLKVESSSKLAKLIGDVKPIIDDNGNPRTFKSDDLKCLLIEVSWLFAVLHPKILS
jgi:growth arrest and DNA-damage-inducible protein